MRHFWSRREAPLDRILLIESGSRSLIEGLLPHLRDSWASDSEIDLITCYAGQPAGFAEHAAIFRVTDYVSTESRKELLRRLQARRYSAIGILCSAEPIMTKWKWLLAARLPVRIFVINENGDYFWVHRRNAATIRRFILVRAGLAGEGAIRTLGRILLFPFSVLFLLLYAIAVHTRRRLRLMMNSR